MKSILFLFSTLALVFTLNSCGDSTPTEQGKAQLADNQNPATTDPVLLEIYDLEKKTKSDTAYDRNTAMRLLRAYQTYYNQHGNDSLGKAYLFEAAKVADALGKYDKAIDLLINYHDLIGDYNKKAESAFLIAFIYDAHKKDSKKAIEHYNKVIELYPKSQWAEQAKSALHLVDMSDEDLIKFLDGKKSNS